MPEGDTVYLSARQLHRALAGQILLTSDFRMPQLATADLTGRTVLDVTPRGKHILIRLDDGRTLHSHFMMDGSWRVYPTGARWRGPANEVRVVLGTEHQQAVGYRLDDVKLVPTSAEADLVGHLGPDLLDPGCDLTEAVRRLQGQPDREIGLALLDQRNLAGIGNLYNSEVLFLRGLWPWPGCVMCPICPPWSPWPGASCMRTRTAGNRSRPAAPVGATTAGSSSAPTGRAANASQPASRKFRPIVDPARCPSSSQCPG